MHGDIFQAAVIDGCLMMGILGNAAMAGKMFADRGHACELHPAHETLCQHGCDICVSIEGPVTDDRADALIQIEDRGLEATSIGGVLPAAMDRLPNDDVLYHAFGDFVTPDGVRLEGRGVIPDQPVALSRAGLLAGKDEPLDAAISWIAAARSAEVTGAEK